MVPPKVALQAAAYKLDDNRGVFRKSRTSGTDWVSWAGELAQCAVAEDRCRAENLLGGLTLSEGGRQRRNTGAVSSRDET
jgi:hypothetical protein